VGVAHQTWGCPVTAPHCNDSWPLGERTRDGSGRRTPPPQRSKRWTATRFGLLISGSDNAKTETVHALAGAAATILSTSRDARATVLAALREVYDGRWSRNVGTDGGRTLGWKGRIVVVGAVTTAWDRAHDVTAAMGDRFVLVRMDSTSNKPLADAPSATPALKRQCAPSWPPPQAESLPACMTTNPTR
jgi:hypothetical protein